MRGRLLSGGDRRDQEGAWAAPLLAAACRHRQHPLHESAAGRAVRPEAARTPPHGGTERLLGRARGRRDAGHQHKGPQRRPDREQLAAQRRRLVADAHLASAYTTAGSASGATAGDGLPLVLRGGRAVATWSHRFEGNRMRVTVTPFAPDALPSPVDEHTFELIGQLLGATAVEAVTATSTIACGR